MHQTSTTMLLRSTQSLLRRSLINTRSASSHVLLRAAGSTAASTLTSTSQTAFATRGFANTAPKTASPWSNFPMAPPDPIIGLTEAYLNDDYPDKVRWFCMM